MFTGASTPRCQVFQNHQLAAPAAAAGSCCDVEGPTPTHALAKAAASSAMEGLSNLSSRPDEQNEDRPHLTAPRTMSSVSSSQRERES